MAWPGITDCSEAIQNPQLCFKGAELEAGAVSVNRRGMPLVFSGAFACVYPVSVAGRTFAVRCFTREVKDQHARYNQLSGYLINVLPPSFVNFEYMEHGISVRGGWYPIVKMDWVEGESLSKFVGSRLNDPNALRRVAAQWRGGPAASLRGLGIAHNDLQHDNVMVQADGRIRLVDYDGIFLPQFRGERSPELGHKNFQHPLRTAEDYDAYVDNFPSLVIYLSLLAIASDPGLWAFYNDDNLIFTRDHYADPGKSQLFDLLKKSPDQTVAKLTERLEECCALLVKDVPDLETVLRGIPTQRGAHAFSGAGGAPFALGSAEHRPTGIPAGAPGPTTHAGAAWFNGDAISSSRAESRQSRTGGATCASANDSSRRQSCLGGLARRRSRRPQEGTAGSCGHGHRGHGRDHGRDGLGNFGARMVGLRAFRRPGTAERFPEPGR